MAKEAAEASKKAAEQAAEMWIGVFRELISEAGGVGRITEQVARDTAENLTKASREFFSKTTEISKDTDEEAIGEVGEAKIEKKKEVRKDKGKLQSRLAALEKMFVSSKTEPADEVEEDEI